MLAKIAEDCAQCADPNRVMVGNRDVVLAVALRGKPDVAARLVADLIVEPSQCASQFPPGDIAGSFTGRSPRRGPCAVAPSWADLRRRESGSGRRPARFGEASGYRRPR